MNRPMRHETSIRHDHLITETEAPMSEKPETDKLTIKRETLRVLTPAELRLAAGGSPRLTVRCR